MADFEISEDKQKLIKTFTKYDNGCDILKDVDEKEIKAPFESNTLLLQILLEIACRNVEHNAHKRQILFLKMWNKLTEAKLTDELKFHMDALFSVRNQAVAEFEKELMRMDSKEISLESDSMFSSKVVSHDEHLLKNSNQCSEFLDYSSKTRKLVKGASIYLEKYQSEFDELSRIGKGGFGTVWKARHKIDDICYAVKKVMFKYKKDSDFLKVIREVKSFATLNHLNVVGYNQAWLEYVPSSESNSVHNIDSFNYSTNEKFSSDEESQSKIFFKTSGSSTVSDTTSQSFFNSIESETSDCGHNVTDFKSCSATLNEAPLLRIMLYIQMEYCDFDLRFWMDERAKGNSLPFQLTTSEIFKDILSGVCHIHKKNIIHRDLKPQNIFFSAKSNSMKIGDFGLATLSDELNEKPDCVLNCGTMPYAAPELRNKSRYDSKVDMYSLGVILIELVTESKTRMELSVVLEQIFSDKVPEELHHDWPQYVALMKNLVSSDPTVRFSAEYALAHLPLSTNSTNPEEAEEIKHLRCQLIEKEKRIEELETLLRKYQSPHTS